MKRSLCKEARWGFLGRCRGFSHGIVRSAGRHGGVRDSTETASCQGTELRCDAPMLRWSAGRSAIGAEFQCQVVPTVRMCQAVAAWASACS